MSFTVRQRKSDRATLRVGDAFTFPVNGSFGLSIVSDFEDALVGFTLIPKSSEVIFGDLSQNYSRFDKVVRIEYQIPAKPKEINILANAIYKKLSLHISRQLFRETFVKAILYRKDFQRESAITKHVSGVKKLPFSTEDYGYDLNGASIKQLKKLRKNLYSIIKGKPATPEDMKFIGFIKKALHVQRDPRAEKI